MEKEVGKIRQNYLKIGGCGFHLLETQEQLNTLECISLSWNGNKSRNFARTRCGSIMKTLEKEKISGFIWDLIKSIFEEKEEIEEIFLEDLFSFSDEKEFTDLWFGNINKFIKKSYNKERSKENFSFKRK